MSVKYVSHRREVDETMRRAKARALEVCGGTAERYAKENLTINESVKTGVLRNSITHEPEDENAVIIGSAVKYAPYVELGHNQEPGRYVPAIGRRLVASHVDAKPFLRPAIEDHRDEYRRIIRDEIGLK